MGVIQKQSTRSTIVILIGFVIGAINMLVLMPRFLDRSQIGLTRAIVDISLTLSTLCTLGTIPVIYKFSPFYRDYLSKEKNDLPFITGTICFIGYSLMLIAGYFFKDFIIRKLGKAPQFGFYFYTIYPYTLFMLMFLWLEAFAWTLKMTVLSGFLKETFLRILNTVVIVLYACKLIKFETFINLFSLLYIPPALVLLYYIIRTGKWKFKIQRPSALTRRFKMRMLSFGAFVFGAQFLHVVAKTNDTILTVGLRGLADAGIFSIATYITMMLEVPQRSISAISTAVLADSWKNRDMDNISNIYRRSISNLLVIGLGMFGLIWLNIHNLTHFLNNVSPDSKGGYGQIDAIFFIMGIAKVIDLGTGVNNQIIETSNYWRFNFITTILYIILSIPLNFVLIEHLGLLGLAYSNLISQTLYNLVRYLFIYKKFGLQPYTMKHGLTLLISIGIYLLVRLIPQNSNLYIDAVIRSGVFILLFLPMVYYLNAAPDLINMATQYLNKIARKNK